MNEEQRPDDTAKPDQEQPADASSPPDASEPGSSPPPAGPAPELVKKAMRAFRKRLKLTKLDEESKLGRSPLTGGKASSVVAIMPPYGYPQEVWDELVRQGKLKEAGRGFYKLAD